MHRYWLPAVRHARTRICVTLMFVARIFPCSSSPSHPTCHKSPLKMQCKNAPSERHHGPKCRIFALPRVRHCARAANCSCHLPKRIQTNSTVFFMIAATKMPKTFPPLANAINTNIVFFLAFISFTFRKAQTSPSPLSSTRFC